MLYAFDGTGNTDKEGVDVDTNVVWFCEAYMKDGEDKPVYTPGIGTRLKWLGGKLWGGMFGAGGHPRVREALRHFEERRGKDEFVDVVGFSRGAALALDLVNRMAKQHPGTAVRFLGLFDTVPAFGVPIVPWDPTWNLELSPIVQKCCHALALDERRVFFKLRRVKAVREGQLCEVWFRGVHSDIGGGRVNAPRASIALDWMLTHAAAAGLELDSTVVENNRLRKQPDAEISEHGCMVELGYRNCGPRDSVHDSILKRLTSTVRKYAPLNTFDLDVVDNAHRVVARLTKDGPRAVNI